MKKSVKIGFLDADKIDRKEQKKMKKFNRYDKTTSCVQWMNPERVRRERGSRGVKKDPKVEEGWKDTGGGVSAGHKKSRRFATGLVGRDALEEGWLGGFLSIVEVCVLEGPVEDSTVLIDWGLPGKVEVQPERQHQERELDRELNSEKDRLSHL